VSQRPSWAAPCVFLFSGAAGLVYQVVWVRQLGNVFGNTVQSAALVTGVFLGGLGLGSAVLGRWVDRKFPTSPRWPLRAYGLSELGVAAWAAVLCGIIPRLGDVSARASSYAQDAAGLFVLTPGSYLARYGMAVVLLLPATFLMGGTFPVLARHWVAREQPTAGWRVGLLYAANTLGAAVGAFLTDALLIPRWGIRTTLLAAIATSAACGLAGLAWSRIEGARTATGVEPPAAGSPRIRWAGATLLLTGFAAMGMEILWYRHLSGMLGEFREVYSLLLTVILVGIAVGAVAGSWLERGRSTAAAFFVAEAVFVTAALAGLAFADRSALAKLVAQHHALLDGASAGGQRWVLRALLCRAILGVAGLPALAMGLAFPLVNAHVQRLSREVGGNVGRLYLFNTLGNVLGAAAAGFALLPALGIQRSAALLGWVGSASLLPMYLSARTARRWFLGGLALAGAAAAGFALLPSGYLLRGLVRDLPGDRVVAVSEGVNELVSVSESPDGERTLVTNGHAMSGTGPTAQRYMRAFAHLPLLQLDAPRRALVICFGVGNTARAASLHPLLRLEVADLSRSVLEQAPLFARWNRDVLKDSRVQTFVNDGRLHLAMQPPRWYDLITLEPPPIAQAGVSALYSRDFYALARSRLAPGGFLSQWLPAYQVPGQTSLELIRAFEDVFPESVLLSGESSELLLLGRADRSIQVDPEQLRRNLAARPEVQASLAEVSLGTGAELLGTFVSSARTLSDASASARPMTDDWPTAEYSQAAALYRNRLEIPVALDRIAEWCPRCAEVPGLPDYIRVLGAYYQSERFQTFTNDPAIADPPPPAAPEDAETAALMRRSAYLRRLFSSAELAQSPR
jgi:spermidine synthase